MGSARTPYVGEPAVVDVEAGGAVTPADIKAAGLVAEKFYDDRELSRIDAALADYALDTDTKRNRAARDRDRAFPRDRSVVNDRKRRRLPEPGDFRGDLSSRQRKDRSAAKQRTITDAPASQIRATAALIADPGRWSSINSALYDAAGNAQHLPAKDRETVQRVDRLIGSYEAGTDRGHVVYVAVELPTDDPVTGPRDVPATLAPGARISFDQFTKASHTLHEAHQAVAAHRDRDGAGQVVILEIETSRGMYMGRSDSLNDTSHLLPRGMAMHVHAVDPHAHFATPTGHDSTLVVQCADSARPHDYTPPVTGRRRLRESAARRAARAAAERDRT